MTADNHFLSLDWGTSKLRLRLVQSIPFAIVAEFASADGIAATHGDWQSRGENSPREVFYKCTIARAVRQLEQRATLSLAGLPIVASGMATASIGICEIPYSKAPIAADPCSFNSNLLASSEELSHNLWLLSGAATDRDVMRGEESELAGLLDQGGGDGLYVLPGTHSKHVVIRAGMIRDWKTYITGELFSLLGTHSLLSSCLDQQAATDPSDAFLNGVRSGRDACLLHEVFAIRAASLIHAVPKRQHTEYLSGLLIGHELSQSLDQVGRCAIRIAAVGNLRRLYEAAWNEIFPNRTAEVLSESIVNAAAARAHRLFFASKIAVKANAGDSTPTPQDGESY